MQLLLDTLAVPDTDSVVLVLDHAPPLFTARITKHGSLLTPDGLVQSGFVCTPCDQYGWPLGDQATFMVPVSAIVGVVVGSFEVAGDTDGAA